MSARCLVTGASGFIGTHLVRRLLDDGWEVGIVARSSSRLADELVRCPVVFSDEGSEAFRSAVVRFAPEVCFHLATHAVGVHGPDDVDPLIEANLGLGIRLADALSALPEVVLVNVGTVWQHHESRPYGPTSLYAATKQAFVDILQFFAECTPLRVVTVELSDTYGPDDQRSKVLQLLLQAHRTQQPLGLSPGEQVVDLVHVDDVVDALLCAVPLADAESRSYAVHGDPVVLRDFVGLLGDVLGSAVPVEWGARPYRPREMMVPWRHFPRLPGWRPRIGLREGLAALLAAPPAR